MLSLIASNAQVRGSTGAMAKLNLEGLRNMLDFLENAPEDPEIISMDCNDHCEQMACLAEQVARGADLNAVKELLGHSSLASTQVYTHNSIEKLKNVYKKAHPKA